ATRKSVREEQHSTPPERIVFRFARFYRHHAPPEQKPNQIRLIKATRFNYFVLLLAQSRYVLGTSIFLSCFHASIPSSRVAFSFARNSARKFMYLGCGIFAKLPSVWLSSA